ncbi:hypothetical protein BVC80_9101g56 [Macleaya cordata]|uniref:Uncharacterized protein n=1 Tax=Macleaya cordata TaxID=56857 RepID=A0A200QGD2_MACCD|nr:hypothetical protein BVC80_9101g56 [Macleaya cordata]
MDLFKLFQFMNVCLVVLLLLKSTESTVLVRFDRVPAARSRFSTAVFRYSIVGLNGTNPCKRKHGCFINCQLDDQTLRHCPADGIILKNLTVNHDHNFRLSVNTSDGDTNSSAYKWFIDTIPPTAFITSKTSYTNAEKTAIDITFSEACTRGDGFKCINTSSCDVLVNGPAYVDASTLQMVEPNIKYRVVVVFSVRSVYGRVVVKMAEKFCTDQAGNQFRRTNGSIIMLHFDRRPVQVDLWTSIPSYELDIGKVPRTVLATNKIKDLEIFLDFSSPVVNSTEDIQSVLHANIGSFKPIHSKSHDNRRFVFKLQNVSRTEIITVKLQSASIIARSGTPASSVAPIAFLYDSTRPGVRLTTRSAGLTKESNIKVVVEFTEPVFGFQPSGVEVVGGRISRQVHMHTKSLYSMMILGVTQSVISILVPEGKANDVAGNLNLVSNQLEMRQYSAPAISVLLHSFVTAGLLATSLAAAVLTLSATNLAAIGALTSGTTNVIISDPSMNLQGMVGHLQVFVFSEWISVRLPIEYSETTKGLRWLIPRGELPWKKESSLISANHYSLSEGQNVLSTSPRILTIGLPDYDKRGQHLTELNSNNFSSYLLQDLPSPAENSSVVSGLHEQWNVNIRNTSYGLPLDPDEYFIYFLREEPLAAVNLIRMENYTGWQDLEMNLFWLGVGAGCLLISQFLILLFLTWRTGTSIHWMHSVPRFELFLLILMLPCISQSSAFVLRGSTTAGIITGALLLAIPIALILSVCLFLIIAIFTSSFVRYKEIKYTRSSTNEPWHTKMLALFTGKTATCKWFYREGLPSSFLPRFGFLFEDRKGPPVFVSVDQNDPNSIPKWIDSGQRGIGRMRAVNFDEGSEEPIVPIFRRLFGGARSAYIILDLLRRVSLGIISGVYSSQRPSQSIIAFSITVVQFLCLFTLKPYIRRGVHVVESISLLCEAAIFGLSIYLGRWNSYKERTMGFVMLTLLFISFSAQLVNEWYALIKCLLQLSQSRNLSFKLGLKCVTKGLILPFLPRKHWSRILPGSSQPKTGLVPVPPLSPETELGREIVAPQLKPLSAMTATIVPMISPGSPGITKVQAAGPLSLQTSTGQKAGGEQRLKGIKVESKSELRKLRELAKASFSGSPIIEEGSSSYFPREHFGSDESSSYNSHNPSPYNRN